MKEMFELYVIFVPICITAIGIIFFIKEYDDIMKNLKKK